MTSLVLYEIKDGVGVVTMNRPEKLNAIDPDLKQALAETLLKADEDEATSVVLLRAAGRSFCVGYDIGRDSPEAEARRHDALRWHKSLRNSLSFELLPWTMKKPVVAEVQGHALGGGCELAMICDITIAADDATFGEPEIRFSTVGPAFVMQWIVGLKKARELMYLGDTIDAATALSLGMVNRVVPAAELPERAMAFARRLARISPEALYTTKLAINRGAEASGFRNALDVGADVSAMLYAAKTKEGSEFKEIVQTSGLREALRWRSGQFRE